MSDQMTLTSLRAPSPKRIWAPVCRALLLAAPGVVLLCFWQFASGRLIRETYVSKPTEIVWRLIDLFYTGEIWPSLRVTGEELVLSYAIGVMLGLLLGYALGRSPRLA